MALAKEREFGSAVAGDGDEVSSVGDPVALDGVDDLDAHEGVCSGVPGQGDSGEVERSHALALLGAPEAVSVGGVGVAGGAEVVEVPPGVQLGPMECDR